MGRSRRSVPLKTQTAKPQMPKSTAQRVREAEASHLARGQKQIRVWVPDTDEAKAEIREHAARLCAEAQEQKGETK